MANGLAPSSPARSESLADSRARRSDREETPHAHAWAGEASRHTPERGNPGESPRAHAGSTAIVRNLVERFGDGVQALQPTADGIPTLWSDVDHFRALLRYAKH